MLSEGQQTLPFAYFHFSVPPSYFSLFPFPLPIQNVTELILEAQKGSSRYKLEFFL